MTGHLPVTLLRYSILGGHKGSCLQETQPDTVTKDNLLSCLRLRPGQVCRLNWLAARVAAAAMVEAAAAKDMPALTVAADDLDQSLSKLWKLRSGRDLDWQTILNHTQDVMRQFFARKLVEELTAEQCRRIASIVDDYLGPATKSVDDLNEVLRLIEDAEFDPYAAISGDASDDCQMGS